MVLTMIDVHMAIRLNKLANLTFWEYCYKEAYYEKWDRTNRLALMVMKRFISEGLGSVIPNTDNAKTFFTSLRERYIVFTKTETS